MTHQESLPRLLDELEHASPFRAERLAREVEAATAALGELAKSEAPPAVDSAALQSATAFLRSSENQLAESLSFFAQQQAQMAAAFDNQISRLADAIHEQAHASMAFRQYVEDVRKTQDRLTELIARQAKFEELANQLQREQERIAEMVRHLRPGA